MSGEDLSASSPNPGSSADHHVIRPPAQDERKKKTGLPVAEQSEATARQRPQRARSADPTLGRALSQLGGRDKGCGYFTFLWSIPRLGDK